MHIPRSRAGKCMKYYETLKSLTRDLEVLIGIVYFRRPGLILEYRKQHQLLTILSGTVSTWIFGSANSCIYFEK